METLKKISEGIKWAHGTIGNPAEFTGKAFAKEELGLTSCEISFGTLPSGQAVPFFHSHRSNEETYIVLSGSGLFQIDEEVFPVSEGSIIRVATHCDRNIRNTSEQNLVYICIQAKENSLGGYTMTDADITARETKL